MASSKKCLIYLWNNQLSLHNGEFFVQFIEGKLDLEEAILHS